MGRDLRMSYNRRYLSYFNPRARMGRDPCAVTRKLDRLNFNPRARMGRDQGRGV